MGLQWEDYDGECVVDLGCRLIPRYWGLGYATEASRAVLTAGFRDLGVERIYAATHVGNARAHRVLESLGGTPERQIHLYGMDMTLYAFAAERLPETKEPPKARERSRGRRSSGPVRPCLERPLAGA